MSEPIAILIVDDEPPLLRLMQAYLQRLGYSVTACADASSALAQLEANPAGFGVVIADLTLPDMRGDLMAQQMIERSQGLRVLLCSGYPFDLASLPPQVRSHFAVLQKPFVPNMLAKSVEELISRSL